MLYCCFIVAFQQDTSNIPQLLFHPVADNFLMLHHISVRHQFSLSRVLGRLDEFDSCLHQALIMGSLSLSGCFMRVLLHGGSWVRDSKDSEVLGESECASVFFSLMVEEAVIWTMCALVCLMYLTDKTKETVSVGQIYWGEQEIQRCGVSFLWLSLKLLVWTERRVIVKGLEDSSGLFFVC